MSADERESADACEQFDGLVTIALHGERLCSQDE
jgi:hypothetical protein